MVFFKHVMLGFLLFGCGKVYDPESLLDAVNPMQGGDTQTTTLQRDSESIGLQPDFNYLVQLVPVAAKDLLPTLHILQNELTQRGARFSDNIPDRSSPLQVSQDDISGHTAVYEPHDYQPAVQVAVTWVAESEVTQSATELAIKELDSLIAVLRQEDQGLVTLSIEQRMQQLANAMYAELIRQDPLAPLDRSLLSFFALHSVKGQQPFGVKVLYDRRIMDLALETSLNQALLDVCLADERTCKAFVDKLILSGAARSGLNPKTFGRWRSHLQATTHSITRHYFTRMTQRYTPQAEVTVEAVDQESDVGYWLYQRAENGQWQLSQHGTKEQLPQLSP